MKRNKLKTFCTLLVIAILFTLSTIFVIGAVTEDTTENSYVKIVPYEDIANYRTKPEKIDGYVFAGWFSDEETCDITTALSSDYTSGPAYAKYVPEGILGVKVQTTSKLWNSDTTDDSTGALRFVTSVDTLNYKEVGFIINIGGADNYKASRYVYQQLYEEVGDGSTTKTNKYVPSQLFHASSTHFKTWTVTDINELKYLLNFDVTPYWITLDGTTVKGDTETVNVNQVRSWDYVFVDDAGEADENHPAIGTKNYPYKTLDVALSDMKSYRAQAAELYASATSEDLEGKDGIVCIKDSLTPEQTSSNVYDWTDHDMDVIITSDVADTSKLDISDMSTVVDASTLDFSGIQTVKMGDGVTFANMTLKLFGSDSQNGAVYANGNRFKISGSVTSENPYTVVYGGGSGKDVSGTDVTILSGTYRLIYGGGRNSDVAGNTYVTLENTNVFDTTAGGKARVHGGCNKGTVEGDTHVTIGKGFNSSTDFNYSNHSKHATVWGGGYGDSANSMSIVKGNTYVTVKDDAKANFISGGGFLYSKVQKTSHVIFEGGYAMSIYGGSAGSSEQENLDNDANGKSANTSVVMTGGEVEQIFGGNELGSMEGNTSVQILGGKVTRRVYGGCYNNTNISGTSFTTSYSAKGNTSVVIGPKADLALNVDFDNALCAVSRYSQTFDSEVGTLIFNRDSYGKYGSKVLGYYWNYGVETINQQPYHYLVKASGDGDVTANGNVLHIKPEPERQAIVKLNDKEVHYATGESDYVLPGITSETEKHTVTVEFAAIDESKDVSSYEAYIKDGGYYPTLEEAVAFANENTQETVVTLLANAEVEETLKIGNSATMTLQSEVAEPYTITYFNADNNLLEASGELAIKNLNLEGGKSSIYTNTDSNVTATNVNVKRLSETGMSLVVIGENSTFTLNEENGTSSINGNNLSGRGVEVNGTFLLNGGTIQNNSITENGAGVYVSTTGKLTMTGGTVQDNTTTGNGGGIYIESENSSNAFTNEIHGGNITGNEALDGAGIYINTNKNVSMKDVTIQNNTATQNGGGVYAEMARAFDMESGNIVGNTAVNGGGVYTSYKGIFTMKGGNIEGNTATGTQGETETIVGMGSGVCVAANENKPFTMTGGTISGHGTETTRSSSMGAGVYVASGAVFDMNGANAVVEDNYSTQSGAGVYVAGTATISNGKIQGNDSKSSEGAGVFVLAGGNFTIKDSGTILENKTTGNGGGVSTRGTFTMEGGLIQSNEADKGAGVIVRSEATANIKGGNVQSNIATAEGGGVYIQSTNTTLSGVTIQGNTATSGGGVCVHLTSKERIFTMGAATIQQNIADTYGAGVYVLRGTFEMAGGTISGQGTANTRSSSIGAGVYVASEMTFNMNGETAVIENNYSSTTGAGVAVAGTFTMTKGTIRGNNTTGKGAGVYVVDGTLNINGGNITNHGDAVNSVTGASEGAGVYAAGTSVVTMTAGSISNNYVSGSGAGVSVDNTAKFTLSGTGAISNNTANAAGGGIIVRSKRTEEGTLVAAFVMDGGTISDNTALVSNQNGNGGGAIFQAGGTKVEINYGEISGNHSGQNGGAIFINPNTSKFTMTGGTIKENTAASNGAGVYVNSGTFDMTGGTISNHGTVEERSASVGAGVYVKSGATFNMSGDNTSIQDNYSSASGAGVAVAGTFNMTGGTINNNGTSEYGGAVYMLDTASKFEMTGGSLNNNTAKSHGGAVYVCSENDNLIINGGQIYKNTSTGGNGGAIAAINKNTIQLLSGNICGNIGKDGTAENGTVDGVFVVDGDGTCKVVFGVDFNMGSTEINGEIMAANSIRFNTLRDRSGESAEPILRITDPNTESPRTSLTHHTSENPLNLKLHANAVNVSIKIQCDNSEAANNIVGALNQTYKHIWNSFEVQEDCIISKCTEKK